MENSFKILSLACEVPAVQRRVPEVPWPEVLAIDNLSHMFGNCPTLECVEAAQVAGNLESRFGFSVNSDSLTFERLFAHSDFVEALKDPANRLGMAYFIQDQIRAGKRAEASSLITRHLESTYLLGTSEEERIALEFLKVQATEPISRAWRDLFQRATDPIAKYICAVNLGLGLIREGKYADAIIFADRLPTRIVAIGNHPYQTIFLSLLRAEAYFAQGKFVEATHHFETAAIAARRWNGLDPVGTYTRLYANLQLAAESRYAAAMQKVGNQEQAAGALERIETRLAQGLPFLLGRESHQALLLALGEHHFRRGDNAKARLYFSQAALGEKPPLRVLTRLNEIDIAQVEAPDHTLTSNEAGTLIKQIEAEKKARKAAFSSDHTEETAQLVLFKYCLARTAQLIDPAREALIELAAIYKDTPLGNILVIYQATQSFADAAILRRVRLAQIPGEIQLATPIQKLIALRLLGTTDPAVFCAIARQAKQHLTHSRPTSDPSELFLITPNDVVVEMAHLYSQKESAMRSRVQELHEAVGSGNALLFSGEVINAYRVLDQAGVLSFEFRADRAKGTVVARINTRAGFTEKTFDPAFAVTGTGDSQFDNLLSLTVVDCFLKIQLGESYRAVFEEIDFKYFTESDYLNAAKLANRLAALLSHRPPSATEKELVKVAEAAQDAGITPTPSPDTESSGERQQVFSYRTYKKLLEPGKVIIDIPRLASLNPLAQLLSAMEKNSDGKSVTLTLYFGQYTIRVNIDREGAISISDYNRGITNLDLILAMQEATIDILNAHFDPQYLRGLASPDPRSRVHAIFMGVQNSTEARQKKWEIYQELRPGERLFTIEALAGMENSFDSTFFELSVTAGAKPHLIPLPTMIAKQAAEAIKNEQRRIVQVGMVGIHRTTLSHPMSAERLNYYIFRFILGNRERVRSFTSGQLAAINAVKTRILGGELTADPHKFLQPDPQEPGQITMDCILVKSVGITLRTYLTFTRPHLRIFELVVSSWGTVKTTLGRRATVERPAPKRRNPPPPSPRSTPIPPLPPPTPPAANLSAIQLAEIAVAVTRTLLELIKKRKMSFGIIGLRGRISAMRLTQLQRGDIAGTAEDLAILRKVLEEEMSKEKTPAQAKEEEEPDNE